MAKKQDSFYFDNFIACAEDSCRAAEMLKGTLEDFRTEGLQERLDRSRREVEEASSSEDQVSVYKEDGGKETLVKIEDLNDIYDFADRLTERVRLFEDR